MSNRIVDTCLPSRTLLFNNVSVLESDKARETFINNSLFFGSNISNNPNDFADFSYRYSIDVADRIERDTSLVKYTAASLIFLFLLLVWANVVPKKKNQYSASQRVSLKCRIINFLIWPLYKFQLREEFTPADFSEVKLHAVKKTGLKDFGIASFYETAFKSAIELANKSCYSAVGYVAFKDFLKRLLVVRLRIQNELKEESMKEFCKNNPIRKPIFIIGLPRTGTTFLQRLLSLDPANTAPLTWELMDPVPRMKEDLEKDKTNRIKYCKKKIDMLLSLIPQVGEIHELGAESPEECMLLMGVDAPALMFNFHTLLEVQEMFYSWNWSEAYKNYYKGLQIIKRYRGLRTGIPDTKRWVLKSPPHLGALDHLTNEFPDARIIWTHRDPKECLPSLASLIRAGQDLCEGSGIIQLDELGQHMLTYADLMYHRGDKFYSTVEKKSDFCRSNVLYNSLINDPVGTVRSLYNDVGYEFTDEYKTNIEAYLVEDKMKRDLVKGQSKKLHKYTLEEYGLHDSEIDEKFAWYMKKYIPSQ